MTGFNHLGRKTPHRKAMLSNMAASLIVHKRIKTTLAKAKALRCYVEPLITKSKENTTHSRRTIFSYLNDKVAVTELFKEVSLKIADRPGGYTRILKISPRSGDAAAMAYIELVDYNENMLQAKQAKKAVKTRRSRRAKTETTASEPVSTITDAKEIVDETPAVKEEPKADTEEPKAPEAEEETK